jgi:hypothetical protein
VGGPGDDLSEVPVDELDDDRDRDELRQRYYGLIQELRVILPGVQVLTAFLLTVPFNQGFERVDETGRVLWGVALVSAIGSVVAFVTPTAFHRYGPRTARSDRLEVGIVSSRAGVGFLAVSLLVSLTVVARFVFATGATLLVVLPVAVLMVSCWFAYPLVRRVRDHGD